jgi:hypothetical protein
MLIEMNFHGVVDPYDFAILEICISSGDNKTTVALWGRDAPLPLGSDKK